MADVQIPSKAVSQGEDVRQPVRSLLEDLKLLGTPAEADAADGLQATIGGPPQSVALIEAGATAASKWWASGLGAAVLATWGSVAKWWPGQNTSVQVAVLAAAALVTAALVVSIGYLIASDVRGRAAAAVSTVAARADVARAMLRAAEAVYTPPSIEAVTELVPLPSPLRAKNLARPGDDEAGWAAVAMERQSDGSLKYVLVKGSSEVTLPVAELEFYS